jgi:hypothetical protein
VSGVPGVVVGMGFASSIMGMPTGSIVTEVNSGTLQLGRTNAIKTTGSITLYGGTLDLSGTTLANALSLSGGGSSGALINSSGTAATASGAIALAAATSLGGSGDVTLSGVVSGAASGLAFVGDGNYTLSNASNALSTIASGSSIGALSVLNGSALTIGQVTVGGTTYSGISSTGSVSVTTNSGNLTVSQNVTTTSTSSTPSTPALKLGAGALTAAGTTAGGDIVLSGSPTVTVGAGGIAAFYTGTYTSGSGLDAFISAKPTQYSLFNSASSALPSSGAGFYGIYRGTAGVPIYLLATAGQFSEYGTALTLTYEYSSSPTSIVPTSITGIPSGAQTFTLTGGARSQSVNVSGGVSGTIALSGSPSIASTGLVSTTNAGTYSLTLTPNLTLAGYTFAAGTNPVIYTINRKSVTVTNTARTTTYDGTSTYGALASGAATAPIKAELLARFQAGGAAATSPTSPPAQQLGEPNPSTATRM